MNAICRKHNELVQRQTLFEFNFDIAPPHYLSISEAAASVGLSKSIVADWAANSLIASIRPGSDHSRRLVDMHDLRTFMAIKREPPLPRPIQHGQVKERRTFLYARMDRNEVIDEDEHMRLLNMKITQLVGAIQAHPSSYMYVAEIGPVDQYNRPGMDALLDVVVSRKIDQIVVQSSEQLCPSSVFPLLKHLCEKHHVSIMCIE